MGERKAPQHLSPPAKLWYRSIAKEYRLNETQKLILQTAFEAWDNMKSAQKIIDSDGQCIQDAKTGVIKAHPMCTVVRDQQSAFRQSLKAIGLDLSCVENGDEDDDFDNV